MVMSKAKYEELRQKRVEENKKKLEQLHLPLLSRALQKIASSPKTSPLKKVKTRITRTELVPVRRSDRFANKPAPQYKEVTIHERVRLPGRIVCPRRDLSNRVYASDEARAWAVEKAEELEATLEGDHPTFVKPMLQSHVTGGFWLGLPNHFCKRHLPKKDDTVTLLDEEDDKWPTVYLARKAGLSGGWRGFAIDHDLVDGDALVFQLIQPAVFKVHIIRENGYYAEQPKETR